MVSNLICAVSSRVTGATNSPEALFATTPAVDSLFLFTARPFDPDTQLQNNLNRWYDARVGRWLSEDPIGFNGGDGNLYRYVGNRTTDRSDPLGFVECPGGQWLWVGTTRGGQVILGYYYYKAKFTCKQSLVVGETCYRCPGQVSFMKKRYKVPVAYGSSSVLALGAGLDSTLYAHAAGTVSAPTSEQLAGWSLSVGVSVTAIAVGGTLSGGFGHTDGSAGLDIGFGFSVSGFPAYTRIWSSGYQLFDEPLSPQELKYLSLGGCQKEYRATRPFAESTPSSFHYMIEY